MPAFSQRVNVSGVASYPASPQVAIPFLPKSLAVVVEDDPSSPKDCDVSFDGTTTAGTLIGGRPSAALVWEGRAFALVWLRQHSSGATSVLVMADS